MSYLKQTFWAMDTYVNSHANLHEINIQDHKHGEWLEDGEDAVQITRQYGGTWTNIISPNTKTRAHKLDTLVNISGNSAHMFTICNSGTIKFTCTPKYYPLKSLISIRNAQDTYGASPANLTFDTEYDDLLNEATTNTIYFVNSGFYQIFVRLGNASPANYTMTLQLYNESSSFVVAKTSKLIKSGGDESIQLFGMKWLDGDSNLIHMGPVYRFRAISSYTGNVSGWLAAYIHRIL